MRKNTLPAALFLVFLLAVTTVFAQRRATRRSVARTHCMVPKFTAADIEDEPITATNEKTHGWPETRFTKNINGSSRCEAYPWISSDGLRLYFTSNRDGGHGNIYFSERNSVSEPFEKVTKVFNTEKNQYYAASLTADELTMYLTLEGYTLYIAERKSRSEPFGTPRAIPELKERKLFGPGISADGREMMVVDYDTRQYKVEQTVWLVKNGEGKFVEKGKLPLPEGETAGPGQISKDGLTYYCSLEKEKGKGEYLYRYTRPAPGTAFTLEGKMNDEINAARENLQPSINGDGTILAYVINGDGSWGGDDIRVVNLNGNDPGTNDDDVLVAVKPVPAKEAVKTNIAQIKISPVNLANISVPVLPVSAKTAVLEPVVRTGKVTVHPNPFTDQLFIEFPKALTEKVLLELFDAGGKRVLALQIPPYGSVAQVNTGRLPAGQYTCRISGSEGVVYSGTLVSGK